MKCYRGCGREATYFSPRKKEWVCSKQPASCPSVVAKRQEQFKKTMLEKYGAPWAAQVPQLRERAKQTMRERYGVACTFESEVLREKFEQTMKERYGDTSAMRVPELIEKTKMTMLERYGAPTTFDAQEIQDRARQTFVERYGVDHPMRVETYREQMVATRYDNGTYFVPDDDEDYKTYKKMIKAETEKTWRRFQEMINPDGHDRGRRDFHLDHRFPIHMGYKERIPVEVMSSLANLELLPWRENICKSGKPSITKEELLELYEAMNTTKVDSV